MVVPNEFIDPWVEVLDDLHGKVEHTQLVDIDFTDVAQYLSMVVHTFMDCNTFPDGDFQWKWKQSFLPL
jgi:hypothetical protein